MPKSAKENDPDWLPSSSNAPKTLEGLLSMMGVLGSPAKKVALVRENPEATSRTLLMHPKSQLLSPSKYTLSTPEKKSDTTKVVTQTGTPLSRVRKLSFHDDTIGVFMNDPGTKRKRSTEDTAEIEPLNKRPCPALDIPPPNDWVNQQCPIPEASLEGMIDIEITPEMVLQPKGNRYPSQNTVMRISAKEAHNKAGLSADLAEDEQWTHFIAFFFTGKLSQTAGNLGMGLKHGNGAMELINRPLANLFLKKHYKKPVYFSVIPEWVLSHKKMRLLQSVTCIVKSEPGSNPRLSMGSTFDMRHPDKVSRSEIPIFESALHATFLPHKTPSIKTPRR